MMYVVRVANLRDEKSYVAGVFKTESQARACVSRVEAERDWSRVWYSLEVCVDGWPVES